MSTLSVTTINTANGTTDLTVVSGNTSAGKLVFPSTGGVYLQPNSSANVLVSTATGNVGIGVSNVITISSGGNTTISGNTTINGNVTFGNTTISGNTTINGNVTFGSTSGIIANGSIGTAGQVLTSNGTTDYWAAPTSKGLAIVGSLQKSSFADATTYYFGSQPQATLITTADNVRQYIPVSGNVTAIYLSAFNNAGVQGTGETFSIYFRYNNTTDTTFHGSVALNMASSGSLYYSNTSLNIAVTAGSYFEFKQVSPTWATNPTNIMYGWTVQIT